MSGRPTHPLEAWTRRTFGEDFAGLVLHGLLDENTADEEFIAVKGAGGRGRERRKMLAVTKPWSEGWGYKPLVLAALLKQLVEGPEIESKFGYSFKAVLNELMWPDVQAPRRVVEDAIGFYYGCGYSAVAAPAEGETPKGLGGGPKLIRTHGRVQSPTSLPQCDQFCDEGNTVWFDDEFISGLRRGRVVFTRTDFGPLRKGGGAPAATETTAKPPFAPVRPPGPRPTVRIRSTPVSKRPADDRGKIWARAVGETEISIDTGAIASAVLRALHRTAARHPVGHEWPRESCEGIAENVHREVDRLVREGAYSVVRQVRRRAFDDALFYSHGLIHSMAPPGSCGRRGARPVWHSQDHFVSSLTCAIEAIEFDGWRPREVAVTVNQGWNVRNVKTATVKMVAAYWEEAEGRKLGGIDSGRMSKWTKSLGLPKFSEVRNVLHRSIAGRRKYEDRWRRYDGNVWAFLTYGALEDYVGQEEYAEA